MNVEVLADTLKRVASSVKNGLVNKETGRRIAAVIPVHIFGHPMEIETLIKVCSQYDIPVIEDAAEALGSCYRGRPLGTFGRIGVLSFNGNKIVTTGGGGAIITDDDAFMERARHLSTTAKVPHSWEYRHDQVGYNFRMPNLNAALGYAQLERLEEFVERKRVLAERYREVFNDVAGVQFVTEPADARSNYWLNALIIDDSDLEKRNALLAYLHDQGILARPIWHLLADLPMYRSCPRSALDSAQRIERSLVNLPSSAFLAGK